MVLNDYVKCCYANKATFAGYVLMGLGLISELWTGIELSKAIHLS